MAITGVRINMTTFINFATAKETFSEFCAAKVFGVISPKISIATVVIAVAMATPFLCA